MIELTQDGVCPCGCLSPYVCLKAIADAKVCGCPDELPKEESETTSPIDNGEPTPGGEESVADSDEPTEIQAPLPSHVESICIDNLTLSAEFPIHEGQEGESKEGDLPPETFDVDEKIFLVRRPMEGQDVVFDGHHHFRDARAATHFVSSKIQKGRLILVPPFLNCRVFCELDGWTSDAIKELSQRANFEGKKAIVITPDQVTAVQDSADSVIYDSVTHVVAIEDSTENGILGYLTQRMTRADFRTKHGYIYDAPVLDAAKQKALDRIRVGTMHSEMHHPQLIPNACDKHGCGPKYIDNPDHKTATPVAIYDRDPDGWMNIKRAILDTPDGRRVWEAAQQGRPYALSVRWLSHIAPSQPDRPKVLDLLTVDDVESPAVDGAGELIGISDSFDPATFDSSDTMTDLSVQGPNGKGEPFYGVNHNTCNPFPRTDTDPLLESIANGDSSPSIQAPSIALKDTMNPQELLKMVRGLANSAGPSATRQTRESAYLKVCRAIQDAYNEGLPVSDYVPVVQRTWKALADEDHGAAYHSGVRGPYIELGNIMEMDPKSGWAPDLRDVPEDDTKAEGRQIQQHTDKKVHDLSVSAQGDSDEEKKKAEAKEMKAKEKEEEEKKEGKMDSYLLENKKFQALSPVSQKMVRKQTLRTAKGADDVIAVADSFLTKSYGATEATNRLAAMGWSGSTPNGYTADPANPTSRLRVSESRPGAAAVEKLLGITDELLRAGPMVANVAPINPDNENTKTLRAYNIKKMTPLMDHWENQLATAMGADTFYRGISDSGDVDAVITEEARKVMGFGDSYTSALASVPNQPTIFRWMLTQAFQDQRFLAFAAALGPGQASQSGPGWEDRTGFGAVFRIPYESYVDPSGNGFEYGGLDFSLLLGENQGIPEGTAQLYWDTFWPYWRMNATSSTIQAIKSIGNGPLNYSLGARNIWHMLARKSRSIDQAGFNEMGRIALEYGAVAISNETYTSGNHGLANQTVYVNTIVNAAVPGVTSTSVVVNLNPTKIANASVTVGSDDYAIYPNPAVTPGTGGTIPVAALRLLAGTAVSTNASPYFGTRANVKNPVVPQRQTYNINSTGNQTTATTNPISVTAPAGQVQGYLGPDGYIYSLPGQTATWALDPMNGIVVFNSIAGVTNNSGVIGVTVTMGSYSYATNFDAFPLVPGINALANTVTGETPAAFNNRLLAQFDFTGGIMASWPRFVAPDLAVMSSTVSPQITEATAFYKLNSPKETDLYPSEEFFATRNGVDLARINTPWFIGDTAILETRRFSTKYAIDTPSEVRGPAIKYDASGNMIPGDGYYMAENSAIFTPQVKNLSGAIINPVARLILLIQGGVNSCGIPY